MLDVHCSAGRLRGGAEFQKARRARRQRLHRRAAFNHRQRHTMSPAAKPSALSGQLDIPGEWWTLFHSKPLNDLIERSLTNNPDLKAAQAALAVARENLLAQKGAFYPSADASFSASRQKDLGRNLRPCPTPTSCISTSSRRRSACPMCRMCSA